MTQPTASFTEENVGTPPGQWSGRTEVFAIAIVTVLLAILWAVAARWTLDHGLNTDMTQHARNAATSNRLGILWPHFLSYWIMSAPCGFCTQATEVLGPLPKVVGALLALKFVLSYAMLRTGIGFRPYRDRSARQMAVVAAVALLLGLAFSLPAPNLYRGQIPPNQWHNTTTIVLMPLALLTFWAACRYLRAPSGARAAWVAVAGLVSVAAKPNFAMAFIPAFPIQLYLSKIPRRWKLIGLAATGIIAFGLAVQYAYLYRSDSFAVLRTTVLRARGQDPNVTWGLTIAPFKRWAAVSPAIPISIVSMLLFPVTALAARSAAARKSPELAFAWILFGSAMLDFIVLDETGRFSGTANFRWGPIATMYILFLVSTALLLEPLRAGISRRRDALAWSAFGAHVLSGVFVLVVFWQTKTYLHLKWSTVFKW